MALLSSLSGDELWQCSRYCTSRNAATSHLPQDEAEAVHVGHDVGLEVTLIETLIQNLRGHVALGAHSSVGGDVHLVGVTEGDTSREG